MAARFRAVVDLLIVCLVLIAAIVISFILQGFGLLLPLFTQTIIDKVLTHRSVATMDVLLGGMILAGLDPLGLTAALS